MNEGKKKMFEEFLEFMKRKEEDEETDWPTEYLIFSDEESVNEIKEDIDDDIISIKQDPEPDSIEEEVLALLGEEKENDSLTSPKIHEELAKRWNNILSKGMCKEEKDKIINRYPPIENMSRLKTPKLNPEAQAALSEAALKRDTKIYIKQKQIAVAVSALGGILSQLIVSKDTPKTEIIEKISDAGRILCDIYCNDNKSRRFFALENMNKDLKQSLQNREPEEFLFGNNLSEGIRTAKAVARAAQDLRVKRSNLNLEARSTPFRQRQMRGRRNVGRGGLSYKRPASDLPAYQAKRPAYQQGPATSSYPPKTRTQRR